MNGLHLRSHRGRNFSDGGLAKLQSNPRPDVQIVARRIPAAMQVHADRGSALEKILARAVAAGNKKGNRAFDACATAQFDSRINARRCSKKSLAQVSAPPLRMG